MSITELSIKRPSLILVIFIVLMLAGLFSMSKLSYELIPKFSVPLVIINTVYPGASPTEVENSVTRVLEDAVSNMENVTSMRSTSYESVSFIFIELKDGTNIDLALQDAQRKVNAAASKLPKQADPPSLTKFASDEFPILSIGATSTIKATDFYDLVADRVKPAISSVEGVGEVRLIGGQEREIRINANRQALEARGMTILQIVQAVQQANLDFPTGKIENHNEQILVRLAGKFQTIEDLKALVVFTNPRTGVPVKLGEVAEVLDSQKDIGSLSRVGGIDAIGIQVLKTSDANSVAVAKGVQEQLEKLESQFKDANLQFSIANNQTDFTIEAVNAVEHDLLLAIVLVAVVMMFFLHSIRNAFIVMLAIPTSLISTMIMMYIFGFSLNMMTLLAMSLVIGILVDDSIVVLENIYRHLEHGLKRRKAALIGRNEIAFTALSITLVDVVVFLPIALTSGIVGSIMRQFALVVTFSTLMSLFVSFTLTPMLASRFSRVEKFSNRTIWGFILNGFEHYLTRLNNWYARLVGSILKPIKIPYGKSRLRRISLTEANTGIPQKKHFNLYLNAIIVLITTFVIFFSSFGLITKGYIGSSFIEFSDRGEFILTLELPKDATLHETNIVTKKAEDYLFKKKDVTEIFTTVGRSSSGMLASQNISNVAEMTVKLVGQDYREGKVPSDLFAQRVRNELEMQLPGVKVTFSQVSFFGGANEDPVQLVISGSDKGKVMEYAQKALEEVKKVPGTLDAKLSFEEGNPEIKVSVDRERMAQLGLSMDIVGASMQTSFNGNTDAQFRAGGKEYDINIKMDDFNRRSIEDISNLSLLNNQGQLIRLSQFANIEQTTGPNQLQRYNRLPSVVVRSKVLGRPTGDVGSEIQEILTQKLPPPNGVNLIFDGDLKRQAEGFSSLLLALVASILLVYLIMVALYDSWINPFVVMFSIPVAVVGALLAIALSMKVLDIFTMLGIIMMVGLVAKNAILLVDFANQAKEEGLSTVEALIEAGRIRLRPILMTTLAMTIGFLPIALAKGAGSEWKNGLAWALIGGLTSSMILTLLIVPVMYLFMDGIKAYTMRALRSAGIIEHEVEEEDKPQTVNGKPVAVEEELLQD